MVKLVHIPYSPWSEKARWALDARSVPYRATPYVPLLGEPILRVRLKKLRGRITVPVLLGAEQVLADSFDIALWANERGSGPDLFPSESLADVRGWNERAEALMHAGRARTTWRVSRNKPALRESVPSVIRAISPLGDAVGALGASYLVRKYSLDAVSEAAHLEAMRSVLAEVAAGLDGGKSTLLPAFSFADIAMAAAMQFVRPIRHGQFALGPESRAAWTEPKLCAEFAQVLEWRDQVFAGYRGDISPA